MSDNPNEDMANLCDMHRGKLLIACPDRPGVVAAATGFLFREEANIVHADQHSTAEEPSTFFMRIEFEAENLESRLPALRAGFRPIAEPFSMRYSFTPDSQRKRIAVFVSKEDHCLLELLWHVRSGDIPAEVALVISNHPDLESAVRPFGIPFHHVPVSATTKVQAEAHQLDLCQGLDLIVLARYMQIVSAEFLRAWTDRVINIHHSFLPAFAGARPYHQAHERGVKLIGATAHYATAELDAGPIIEQDVQRVDHRADPQELRRLGRQVERAVLARAVKWHVEDRVIVHGNRTVVFA
jgi:formyltetrahydrofolate deformylase